MVITMMMMMLLMIGNVVKAEAERLRQQREMQHEEEFSQLKLAEEELVQVSISSLLCFVFDRSAVAVCVVHMVVVSKAWLD